MSSLLFYLEGKVKRVLPKFQGNLNSTILSEITIIFSETCERKIQIAWRHVPEARNFEFKELGKLKKCCITCVITKLYTYTNLICKCAVTA